MMLTVGIKFDINKDKCEFYGNFTNAGIERILTEWIRSQMGGGEDTSPANRLDLYEIEIDWYPENDKLVCRHNCGNKGLREGIIARCLQEFS
jgi:hypothetical protein